jgi:hypothetical protein
MITTHRGRLRAWSATTSVFCHVHGKGHSRRRSGVIAANTGPAVNAVQTARLPADGGCVFSRSTDAPSHSSRATVTHHEKQAGRKERRQCTPRHASECIAMRKSRRNALSHNVAVAASQRTIRRPWLECQDRCLIRHGRRDNTVYAERSSFTMSDSSEEEIHPRRVHSSPPQPS